MEPIGFLAITGRIFVQLIPVWIALFITFFVSIRYKKKLGLYGRLFDNSIGMFGFFLVMFWFFSGLFSAPLGDIFHIATQEPLDLISGLKNKPPGTAINNPELYPYALLGGDTLSRDVFSRAVVGSWTIIWIAPLATLFAFMVGITLGLPAGYYGGKLDTVLSFLANLVLAFPVILIFFLLVTPEIINMGLPAYIAAVLFVFPVVFLIVLLNSRFHTIPKKRNLYVGLAAILGIYIYLSVISSPGSAIDILPASLDFFNPHPNLLTVFVSVVFVNSPTVFRIVRGLTMDVKSRDYVGAAQTRGEGPWYIMLWEILPNVRGPLIVDFCLRIGYTTILLGTLGFFGLGLAPESPDWGTTINVGRKLLSVYPWAAMVPALCLLSLVLGLNLLADGLREESMKD